MHFIFVSASSLDPFFVRKVFILLKWLCLDASFKLYRLPSLSLPGLLSDKSMKLFTSFLFDVHFLQYFNHAICIVIVGLSKEGYGKFWLQNTLLLVNPIVSRSEQFDGSVSVLILVIPLFDGYQTPKASLYAIL